jgi:glutathione S-transferase
MRALAEAPRLLFHYTNIEYEDLMSWDYYEKEWSDVKTRIPFKQLPMLIVDKKHEICQSMAIMTFIENLAGINISDPILNAKANAIMQSAQELFMPLNPTVNFAIGEKFIKKKDDMIPFLLSRFEDLEKAMKNNDKKFFIYDEPRACDFVAFHHLDLSKMLDPSIIKKFPRLEKFLEDIMSIESVKSYLDKRPELIDVSVEPKLVIDGVPQSTGVKKT